MGEGSAELLVADDERQPTGALQVWWPRVVVAGALVLTLVLRLLGIGTFVVADEDDLALEANAYYNAVLAGDWAATARARQPAVVSRWIGAVASAVLSQQHYGGLCASLTIRPSEVPASCTLDELAMLTAMHTGTALVTWLLLCLCALWLWQLYRPQQAALAVALLAFDPFLLAHSRLANAEGMLAYLLLGSVLCLSVAQRRRRKGLYVVSAILSGLAMAEKLVGVYGLIVAAVLIGHVLRRQGVHGRNLTRRWLSQTLLWAALASVTVFAIWPALWVSPLAAARVLLQNLGTTVTATEVTSQHFLLGAKLSANATPLLYVLTLLFRLTPVTLIGLVVAMFGVDRDAEMRREVLPWLLFGLGFALVLSLGTQQAPNYILTIFAAVDIAGALSLRRLARRWAARRQRDVVRASGLTTGALAIISLLYLVPFAPYYLTGYNLLLGGAPVAVHAVDVGIGEGLELAGAYLSDLPDSQNLVVAADLRDVLQPFFPGHCLTQSYESIPQADYVVFYINRLQNHTHWDIWLEYEEREPVYQVRLHGVPYVSIYQNDRSTAATALTQ